MKSWVLALGGSLALHLAMLAACWAGALPKPPAPKVERRGEGFVSFTAVSLAPRSGSTPQAPEEQRVFARPRPLAARAEPGPPPQAGGPDAVEESAGPLEGDGADEGPSGPGVASAEAGPAAGPALPPGPAVAPGPGLDQVLTQVHARLTAVADGCYPAAARRFQQRGTAVLSFCLDRGAAVASSSIDQSSGAAQLDAAARGCVLQSAAPFPPEAGGRCFQVPVRFGKNP